jgi:hypothetical protein
MLPLSIANHALSGQPNWKRMVVPSAALRSSSYLVAVGRLERVRWYRSLWAFQLIGVTMSVNAAVLPA